MSRNGKNGAAPSGAADIAIIGVSGRFPEAANSREFFDNLLRGVNSIKEIPAQRWSLSEHYSPDVTAPNRSTGKWLGALDGIDRFDDAFFQISPREAMSMDPQQRLLLEEAWRCVEDSGMPLSELQAKRTAVYAVTMNQDYQLKIAAPGGSIDSYAAQGNYGCILANRISYVLGLHGESLLIDAACASSVVAIHHAKRALERGEIDYALVGAVNLHMHPFKYISFSKARFFSPEGQCKAFDQSADGYVPGEGVGVLLLQRLRDAESMRNHVYGVVKGAAVNHVGASPSLTAPTVEAQHDVIVAAYEEAGFSPETVTYVEAHGTGTSLGDPIEVEALTRAFRRFTAERQFCGLGSVKTNIGHLDAAAGIAGVIKVLMMMRHGEIPPSLHHREPNPIIDFAGSPFAVVVARQPWRSRAAGLPLRAGVSSFGFGGVSSHVLMESHGDVVAETAGAAAPADEPYGFPFMLSARSPSALERLRDAWRGFVETEDFSRCRLRDICATLATGRRSHPFRLGGWIRSRDELRGLITAERAAPSHRAEAPQALRVAAVTLRGGAAVRSLAERDPGFGPLVEEGLQALAQLGPGAPDGQALWRDTWAPGEDACFRLLVGHAYLSQLLRAFTPALLVGEGEGMWGILTASGALGLEAALAALSGRAPLPALRRPQITVYDPVAGLPLLPYALDEGYARLLVEGLSDPGDDLATQVRKARALHRSQFTYRKLLEEWAPALRARGESLERLLSEDALLVDAPQGRASKRRVLLMLIVLSAMGKLSRKWDLTPPKPRLGASFLELLALVIDGVLPIEVAAGLILDERPDVASASAALQRRMQHLRPDGSYPLLREHSQTIVEIPDPGAWLRDALDRGGAPPSGRVALRLGKVDGLSSPDAIAEIAVAGDLSESTEQAALRLWLSGAELAWDRLFPQGTFKKVSLPVTVFEGRSFWLPAEAPVGAAEGAAPAPEVHADRIYAGASWEERPLAQVARGGEPDRPLLLFARDEEMRTAAREQLAVPGAPVVLVLPGARFRDLGGLTYEVGGAAGEYQRLIHEIAGRGLWPSRIVHAWSLPIFPESADALREQLNEGALSFITLSQALLAERAGAPVRSLYVFAAGSEVLPQHAAVGGLVRALAEETSTLRCTTVELRGAIEPRSLHARSDAWWALAQELGETQGAGIEVRYIGRRRFVRGLREADLEAPTDAGAASLTLRDGGVYVITGGAGGLGLLFAEHLARQQRAQLVLVGRSELTDARRARIERLNAIGRAAVTYIRADITRPAEAQALVRDVTPRFGPIRGVFHAAGVYRPAPLIRKGPTEIEAILAPKVYGTLNLDAALASTELDFFVLFSSLAALKGYAGLTDYAYSNSFLDHFAERREVLRAAGRRAGRTLSINWPLWEDGGMLPSDEERRRYAEQSGLVLLTAKQGMQLWDVLAARAAGHQCLAVCGDRSKVRVFLGLDAAPPAVSAAPETRGVALDIDRKALRFETERWLRQILAEETRVPSVEIDPREDFESYGIDSLLVHHFNTRIERLLGATSKTLLFETRNLSELTDFFVNNHATALAGMFRMQDGRESGDGESRSQSGAAAPSAARATRGDGADVLRDEDIAIVGLAGRYPNARDIDELWDTLRSSRDCVTEVPPNRWDYRKYYDPDPKHASKGKIYAKWGAFLENVDKFDPLFFNISPKEAETLDPQERLFLQVAWAAFEDAGYTRQSLRERTQEGGGEVGVFVGVTTNTYLLLGPSEWRAGNHAIPMSMPWSIANRVSYVLDLHGPSVPLDTACASSLTAIHLACESLRRGESGLALAGGVNLTLHPSKYAWMCQQRMLSPTGRCRAFGAGADGFVPGEGVGAVLLKPLRRALMDGDPIHGIIKGSSSNHGGRTNGYTVPNPNAQAALILQALRNANVDAGTVTYVEAHGTGTALGDPIEIAGLTKAFRENTEGRQYCAIGSIKSNIGHLEAAAGIAGLTKILLQMRHRTLVPSLHTERLSSNIDFEQTPFFVQRGLAPWETTAAVPAGGAAPPRRACLSSFGAGGSNAHVVIEEYDMPPDDRAAIRPQPELIVLSAKGDEQLMAYAERLAAFLEGPSAAAPHHVLADVAFTLQIGREAMDHRLAILAGGVEEAAGALRRALRGELAPGRAARGDVTRAQRRAWTEAEAAERVQLWVRERRLEPLMEAWVQGAEIDWHRLPARGERRRVSLPTYPFLNERVWISDREVLCEEPPAVGLPAGDGLHPLIDANVSTLTEIRFKKALTGDEFFLRDHGVGESLVLPGVAIAEMARSAGELAGERPARRIKNVTFTSPIRAAAEPVDVYARLVPAGDAADVEVYSLRGGERISHAQGKVVYAPAGGDERPEHVDLQAVRRRCPRSVPVAEGYARLARIGLRLGASYQVNVEVRAGDFEAIGRMELPPHLRDGARRFALHPALVDGAQQVTALAGLRGNEEVIHIPFSVGEYEVVGPLPDVCFAYVRLLGGDQALRSAVQKFDVLISDEAGKVLVRIKNFVCRPMQPAGPTTAAAELAATRAPGSVVYLGTTWEPAALPLEAAARALSRPVLLLDTGDALRGALEARLGGEGAGAPQVVLVEPGSRFERTGERRYTVRPGAPDDYAALLEALRAAGWMPGAVVHRWADDRQDDAPGALEDQLGRGVYALLLLSQALVRRGTEDRVQMLYAYASGPGGALPRHAAIGGFGRTLQLENPRLRFKALELRGDDLSTMAAGDLADIVARELRAESAVATEIRYERSQRWMRRLQQLDLGAMRVDASTAPLRDHGVYVVTGGLGGLGLIFCEHLARTVRARVALVGRSSLDSGKAARLEQLRRLGAEIDYIRADVSQRDHVERLVSAARSRFGSIHGVVHAAGVIRDALVRNQTLQDAAAVIRPKLLGAMYLDEALRDQPLDFFALFSSTTALLGNLGQAAYAYANGFLDAFAERREALRAAGQRVGKTISINWPLWRDGGMRVDAQTEQHLLTSFGMRPMSTEAGLRAFELALATGAAHVAVIEGEPQQIARVARATTPDAPAPDAPDAPAPAPAAASGRGPAPVGPAHPVPADALIAPLQRDLRRMLSAMLKLPEGRISLDQNISEYGIESIALMTLSNQINAQLGLEITPAIFFEHPTLGGLAHHLVEEHGGDLARRYGMSADDRGGAAEPAAAAEMRGSAERGGAAGATWAGADEPAAPGGAYGSSVEGMAALGQAGALAREPVAIIGMSGIMPQSEDLEAFWRHLAEGRDLITEIPKDRWDWRAWFGDPATEPNKTNIKWGGFIEDVDKFDARFFGISRREAEFMDPQQRVFLEVVWRTIEDAGYRVSELAKGRTGVFAGVSLLDYSELLRENRVDTEAYTTTGMFHSILANRISYLFNLRGPSVPVDTACSSSLVAIRQAIEAIWAGSCDVAIAGGINLLLHPMVFVSFSKAGMLSLDGRCKAFDKRANGYVRAEGAGALLLKPLRRALADGDQIHAVIRGSAVNHGGKVNTMTAPNPNAQAELITSAFEEGQIDPATVTYMEAHGTGTSLGDPIEINGLKKAFKEMFRRRGLPQPSSSYCGVGSVKSNIGHLEPAAAISGIFKVILAMKHGRIPSTIHFTEINPYIQLENSPFFLVTEGRPWERIKDEHGRTVPRRAGVSSFGFGGVNGHVVLEEFVPPSRPAGSAGAPCIVPLSAKTKERLQEYVARTTRFIEKAAPSGAGAPAPVSDGEQLAQLLETELVALTVQVGGLAEAHVSLDEPIAELGLDAVHAAELARRVGERLDVPLAPSVFIDWPSLGALAWHLLDAHHDAVARRLGPAPGPESQGGARSDLDLMDLAYTLQIGREPMEERLVVAASSLDELAAKLRAFHEGKDNVDGLWCGNAVRDEGRLEALLDGGEGADFVRTLIENRRLDKLAQLWISGVDVDWKLLYPAQLPRRISLPTYPFARDRFWIPKGRRESATRAAADLRLAHPLLDGIDLGLSLREGVAFRRTLRRSEPLVAHHEVGGRLVFPGVGQLAMAIAAGAQVQESAAMELTRVAWLRPLVIDEDTREVRVVVRDDGGALEYEVRSGGDGGATVHSKGALGAAAAAEGEAARLPVEAIKARCGRAMGQQALYEAFGATGVVLGAYFRTIEQAWIGDGEALAAVRLPPEFADEAALYPAHPTLLDAALQTMGALSIVGGGGGNAALLPFAVDRIELLRPLGQRGHLHVQAAGNLQFHAVISDEEGRACVKLHDVAMREAKDAPARERFFFRPGWREAPIAGDAAGPSAAGAARQATLIVAPPQDLGLGAALAAAHPDEEVIEIRLGYERRQRAARVWEVPAGDPDAIATCLDRLPSVGRIYFLGGLQATPVEHGDLGALDACEQRGVLSLFRLIKALRRRSLSASPVQLTVVTNDVNSVLQGESISPFAAGLYGLTRSLAREHPAWSVRCLDVRRDEIGHPELVKAIVSEIGHPDGAEVALRDGRRYARVFTPIRMPKADLPPFRSEGVYLVVGGASGIGLELALHLATTARARLALVGRTVLGPAQRDTLARIEALGGQAIYLRADLTDPEDIGRAITETRARFGAINGVVHSALVLRDRLLENMDEPAFRAALAPKTRGSVALYRAIRGEALDFLLFFSSAQSFTGNVGQSNYAAACTFKDAFARYLGQTLPYPVRIINWGYWGTVGVVATEGHRRSMAEQGVLSIGPEQGMAAIERVLSGPVEQVMAISAEERVLAQMGVDLGAELSVHPAEVPPMLRAAALDRRPTSLPLHSFAESVRAFDEVERFARRMLLAALRQMGALRVAGERRRWDELAGALGVAPAHARLFNALLGVLSRADIVRLEGPDVVTMSIDAAGDELTLSAEKERLAAAFPERVAYLELLWRCLRRYPEILRGEIPATEILFPGGSTELVAPVYGGNTTSNYYNRIVAESVLTYLEAQIPLLPAGRKIQIVELGAGTGGTSVTVLDAIRAHGDRLRYVYTDISPGFINQGQQRFVASLPFMEFRVLDIEREVEAQGFVAGSFDVVIATNVLHATRQIARTLGHAKSLLRARGWLVLNEVTEVQDFTTLTFGLLEGWWLFEDDALRLPASPLLSAEAWRRVLGREGFAHVVTLGQTDARGRGLGQSVLVAESDGLVRRVVAEGSRREAPRAASALQARSLLGAVQPAAAAGGEAPGAPAEAALAGAAPGGGPRSQIERAVVDILAQVLEVSREEIHPTAPYTSLGVDSIQSVAIVDRLNKAFGITLRSTDLFNYPTVRRLSGYMLDTFGGAVARGASPAPATAKSEPAAKDGGAAAPRAAKGAGASAAPRAAHAELGARPPQLTESELRARVEETTTTTLAQVLEVGREEIHPTAPYTSLGVDSIQSVAIVDRLNKAFGITLRSTDLFNYPTVRKLAAHMIERFGASIRLGSPAVERASEASARSPGDGSHTNGSSGGGQPRTLEHLSASPGRNGGGAVHQAHLPEELPWGGNGAGKGRPAAEVTPSVRRDEGLSVVQRAPSAPPLVAVIGMAGRFPGARDVHELWQNLAAGVDSVQEIARWDQARFYDADPHAVGKSYSKWAGLLPDIDSFDPLFFNISPKEAELMDPRQRLFLEESWKALEDAGCAEHKLDGKGCAVFVGCSGGDYKRLIIEREVPPGPHMFMGTSSSILAARISYLLNLKGPSVPIDTACSSSLVALHLACEGIRNGAYEMALVGGAEVLTTPEFHVMASRTGMLSPEGRCMTFDQRADGFVPGEAVAAIVLKDLDAARRDGDRVYGVIAGSSINQDGKTNGITSPSAPSQTALERDVYERFGIDPASITYVEAHGTGTRLGDPIEIQALTDAFRAYTDRRQYCAIGSVKTNIGHTLTAAGVVGVIKVLLGMQHRKLVPSLHLQRENELIDFRGSPFYVNATLKDWDVPPGAPRQAAVSAFGFSGTNAHVIVREASDVPDRERAPDARPWYLVALSAKTHEALRQRLLRLADWIERADPAPRLRDVASTLLLHRTQHPLRIALVARSTSDLVQQLRAASSGGPASGSRRAAADEPLGRQLLAELRAGTFTEGELRARLEPLASLYIADAALPWAELFEGEDCRQVALPSYPFCGERYWLPEHAAHGAGARGPSAVASLHPLLAANTSTFEEQRFTTELSGGEPFLRDHVVGGLNVLPGVIVLEMARAAGELSAGRKPLGLRDVVWVSAIVPAGGRQRLSISLHPQGDQASYEVWTEDAGAARNVRASGRILYGEAAAPLALESVDLPRLRDRLPTSLDREACYLALQRAGLDYGPTFRIIRRLYQGENAVLAHLELPPAQIGAYAAYVLTPGLLDGALQSALWLLERGSPGALRPMPFGIGELTIAGPLPPSCYALVTPAGSQGGLHKFDVLLLDEAGQVLVRIRQYGVRARPQHRDASAGTPGTATQDSTILDLFRQVQRNTVEVAEAYQRLRGASE
ncbi:SDR family NAD(P)-dependent oxidoreductase [Sorangium sp. So ce204]|uniref:SDR family NAD(P)-dependent oxidoreductase n=1 Tax=Sorangium sp. So ce204 TaxID=3133288 RepID=UPI003F639D18